MTLDLLDRTLRRDPHRPALLGAGRDGAPRVLARRGEIADLADAYAASLRSRHGLRGGDTLGVAVRPGPRSLAVMLAAHRLGLRVAVLDPSAGPDVLRARLALAPPALILADAAAQAVAGWAAPLARRAHLALPPLGRLGAAVATVGPRRFGCAPALDLSASAFLRDPVATANGDGDAVIVFTSGTTAAPRAVVHSRASLAAGMSAVADLVCPRPGTIVLGGTFFVLVPALAAGATVALPARTPQRLNRQIVSLRPDETYLTPPQARTVRHFTGRVWTGSAPASAQLLGRIRAAGASEAWSVYALTELFPAAAVEYAEKAAFADVGDLVGRPLPGVRARLADDGELLLTGPGARERYLGEAPDPWIRTGDRATLAADGSIVLAGRCKDMVLRRAENIYPGLYEPSLHLPEVESALLVGIPAGGRGGDDGDERLVALIQPREGADRGRLRADLEVPLARMGRARPDAVVFGGVPLAGRSRKPDRQEAARLCARLCDRGPGRR
ncbi:acyl--CoA ligase [Actinospica durhamensis]|uniref:Acyl--CoA ligase n=1 Tax=Actinospica durhamensis TaxID=1508375 RepID=A0A941IW26_9ACTN|nr:class I adenylate-forming enzyme family protein [Actinospica durhamensis]MBR7838361.1 acyl--CoA ligase [Actinospica durhamensis]